MMDYFLRLEVREKTDDIFLSQGKYKVEILKKFGMTECKFMPTTMVMELKKYMMLLLIQARLIHN